jgi:hypothetical protein
VLSPAVAPSRVADTPSLATVLSTVAEVLRLAAIPSRVVEVLRLAAALSRVADAPSPTAVPSTVADAPSPTAVPSTTVADLSNPIAAPSRTADVPSPTAAPPQAASQVLGTLLIVGGPRLRAMHSRAIHPIILDPRRSGNGQLAMPGSEPAPLNAALVQNPAAIAVIPNTPPPQNPIVLNPSSPDAFRRTPLFPNQIMP